MIGTSNGHSHAGQAIDVSTPTTLSVADQYYQINGPFSPMSLSRFIHNIDGTLTCVGGKDCFLFSGASDLEVNKACKITYGLFKNGTLVAGAETPHDFAAQSKIENISITAILSGIKANDYFDVRAKSSVSDTILTVATLLITFWGE